MKYFPFALICAGLLFGLSSMYPGNKVLSSNGTMQRGSSVVCPDNASQWVCSINSSLNRNAPPLLGCPVLAERNAQGRLTITINKADLAPDTQGTWFQNDKFYTPQTIEVDKDLSLTVMGTNAAKYLDPGFYPIIETETAYRIIF